MVNLVASDLDDLLSKIDGDTVDVVSGKQVLHTKNAKTEEISIGFADQILEIIA
ncbi:MAG TPA: serine protease, partial [candidate division Zixibacteria bacterium]|nr:serine protease [candidate division Zixibacteria bacterium]